MRRFCAGAHRGNFRLIREPWDGRGGDEADKGWARGAASERRLVGQRALMNSTGLGGAGAGVGAHIVAGGARGGQGLLQLVHAAQLLDIRCVRRQSGRPGGAGALPQERDSPYQLLALKARDL